MIVKKEQITIIQHTEIEQIDDVWERCKAHEWDNGDMWNKCIACHRAGALVKVVTQIFPEHKIISVEEVTDKMIAEALSGSDKRGKEKEQK